MASSSYYPVAVLPHEVGPSISWDFPALKRFQEERNQAFNFGGSGSNMWEFYTTLKSVRKPYMIVQGNDHHTCRETLLSNIRYMARVLSENSSLGYSQAPKYFVYLKSENGDPIPADKRKKAVDFGQKFFRSIVSNIRIMEQDELLCVALKISFSGLAKDLYLLSLVLWIIRNTSILDAILEKFSEDATYKLSELMKFLSVGFLQNSLWGDSANPNVALSFYTYAMSYTDSFSGEKEPENGPVNAAMKNLPTYMLINYLREVYVPIMGLSRDKIPQSGYLRTSFLRSIKDILDLLDSENRLQLAEEISTEARVSKIKADYMEQESRLFQALSAAETMRPIFLEASEIEDEEIVRGFHDEFDDEDEEEAW